ncbi:hypothetical protein [Candidatus Nitrosotenuis uzonensis]|uniref:hypothetical protein n=1 Tax=Candidatus Nitrosotenuis uzonensis TaxID=1407055 RepID=UPI001FCCC0E5|nr:hypothetical protein [Candidatus Nitrosotenuis uzonensis]
MSEEKIQRAFLINPIIKNCYTKSQIEPIMGKTKHVEYHKDGSILAKGNKINGVLVRYLEWFRKDGKKIRSGRFKNGEKSGEWITYDKNGKPYKLL